MDGSSKPNLVLATFPVKGVSRKKRVNLYTISADCLLLAETSSCPFAVVQPGSGLFSSLDVASKLHGVSAGHLEEGVMAHTEDSGKRSKAAVRPSSPLCLHTRLLPLLLERHALQGRSPVRGPGTAQGSGLRLLSLYLASSPLLLRT